MENKGRQVCGERQGDFLHHGRKCGEGDAGRPGKEQDPIESIGDPLREVAVLLISRRTCPMRSAPTPKGATIPARKNSYSAMAILGTAFPWHLFGTVNADRVPVEIWKTFRIPYISTG